LVLPLEPLLPLQQLRLLCLQPGEVLWLGYSPGLMQVRDHARGLQQLNQPLPDDGIESLSAYERGSTPLAVTVTTVRPRHAFAASGFLQSAAPGAFGDLGPFVFGDHALHLCQPCALRAVAEWIVEKDHRRGHLLALLDQEPLMRIVTSPAIG
jgi:hypothetical protein